MKEIDINKPRKGYGYKKVTNGKRDYILELEVLGTVRGPNDRGKLRTSKARVTRAWSIKGPHLNSAKLGVELLKSSQIRLYSKREYGFTWSGHGTFKYTIGKIVVPECAFDTSSSVCSSGIHYFKTIDEAIHYNDF